MTTTSRTGQGLTGEAERHIAVQRDGAVATIYLDRPHRRNAYTPQMNRQLRDALAQLESDDAVRAIVLTGRDRWFCVGADLDVDWRDREVHGVETVDDPDQLPWKLNTPLIAAINGDAIGVGLTWTVQFDIRVVAESARIAFSFNRVGIMPDRNSTWLLPRLIGFGPAIDLLMTGRTITGAEAHRLGLATHCLPAGEVLAHAQSIARDIAERCAPASVTVTKRLMYEFLESSDRLAAYNYERRTLDWIRTLGETVRGIAGFKDRTAPEWGTTKSVTIPPELR